jgi:hypothetical protein
MILGLNKELLTENHQNAADQQGAMMDVAQQGREHAYQASQSQLDRNTDIRLKLMDILKTIVASQYKQDPSANAGEVLADDAQAAARGLT